jgi:hypothetical protein
MTAPNAMKRSKTASTVRDIRYTLVDFDGDGDDEEGMYYEVDTMLTDAVRRYSDVCSRHAGRADCV